MVVVVMVLQNQFAVQLKCNNHHIPTGWLMWATIKLTGTLYIAAYAQQAQQEKLCIYYLLLTKGTFGRNCKDSWSYASLARDCKAEVH